MKQNDPHKHLTVHISPSSILWVVVIGLLLWTLFVVHELVLVIITAIVIAAALSPISRWFVDRKVPRIIAVLVVYAGMGLVLSAAFYFLLLPLLAQFISFINNLPQYIEVIEGWTFFTEEQTLLSQYPAFQEITAGFSVNDIVQEVNRIFSGFTSGFVGTLLALFGGVLNFILILVLSFYLSVQENGVVKFLTLVTPEKHTPYVLDLWRRAENKIGLWLQGQIVLAVIVAVLVYLGLTLLGIPHALLLAALAGLMELIPIFGPIIAAIPAVIVAFVAGDITEALLVVGLYVVIQQFESQLIYPLVVRKVVGLSPIIVIISLIAGFQLGGFLGVLLSVPIAAVVMEFLGDIGRSKEPATSEEPVEVTATKI